MISGRRAFRTVCIFYLLIASAALLGVGRWGGFSPHKVYTGILAWFESVHFRFVYFYKVNFQHLGLLEKSWGLRSVLRVTLWFFPSFSGGGFEVAGKFNVTSWAICWGYAAQFPQFSPLFHLVFFNCSSGRILVGFLSPVIPAWHGFWSSRIGPHYDFKKCPQEVFSLPFFPRFIFVEGISGPFSLISGGLIC